MMTHRLRSIGSNLLGQVKRDDLLGLAAELAFRWFLSLFPFAIFLAGVGGAIARNLAVQNPAEVAKDRLTGVLPPEAASLIADELDRIIRADHAGLISFGMVAAIWFATGGTNAVIKALNRVFDVEETRPLVRRYAFAVALTVAAGLGLIAAVGLVVGGQLLTAQVIAIAGLPWNNTVATWAGWLLAAAVLFAVVVMLYRLAPNSRLSWRWIVPGAAAATVAWVVGTYLFGWYVSNLASYGATFGALAGVAVLLLWLYMTGFLLLLGAEIDDVLAAELQPQRLDEARAAQGAERASEDRERTRSGTSTVSARKSARQPG